MFAMSLTSFSHVNAIKISRPPPLLPSVSADCFSYHALQLQESQERRNMTEVVKSVKSLCRAEDFREDTKKIMQPYANWEKFLVPGPVSIAILGELVCISSDVDFSINKNPPSGGFQFIKYPESFRACLMQVANSGWAAFNEAHKNMDQIRLHTASVPGYVTMAVKILLQDNDELVQTLLPDQLENIATISKQCTNLAKNTEKKFNIVINLIQELLEACVNAKKIYGDELEEVKRNIEATKEKKKASDKANERATKAYEELNKHLEEAQNTYNTAINSMPSGWEVLGMNFVEGLMQGLTGMVAQSTTIIGSDQKDENKNIFATSNVFSKSGQLLKYAQSVRDFVHGNKISWSDIYDQQSEKSKTAFLKEQFEQIQKEVKDESCKEKELVANICTKAVELCAELTKIAPTGKCDDAKTKELISGIQDLFMQAHEFDSKSKSFSNTPAFTPQPPLLSKSSEKKGAGEAAVENARFRIEQSRAQLEKMREAQKQSLENLEKNQKELTEILITLRSCEVKEIDFTTTIKMLVKGLDAMGRVKEQWEKMVRFFQMISSIIETCLSTSLNNFVKTSEKSLEKKLSYDTRMFQKDLIYQQAFHASNVASLVNMISGTYVEISEKHLMDRVSSLGKLMALDPKSEGFVSERLKLQKGCDEAQEAIKTLVSENCETYDKKTKQRFETIQRELNAVLPPASEKETEKLRSITAAAFKDLSTDDANQFC
ncbi:centrosomal protein of 290 kDa-like isoform X1 [Scleropages formosus]|uniref:Centrosomal protein of 290 kDa-like n=1 Tax=Scleropages formosus TaxID=113540 RepID=A0A8C9TLA5_SCLFO|nr:centrosomal protein of 290 kDa-like isoform X1 [Scleropages formosus]